MSNFAPPQQQKTVYLPEKSLDFLFDMEALKKYSKMSVAMQKKENQKRYILRKEKRRAAVCGRGFGKSHLEGKLIAQMFRNLPGCLVGLASLTYGHILNVELPEITYSLRKEGIAEGLHYVIGVKPPTHFFEPFRKPRKYEHVISFCNGFSMVMLSQERPNLARGYNLDGLINMEAAFLNEDWVNKVLIPTVRANADKYKIAQNPLHRLIADFTSAPHDFKGQWVYKTEAYAKSELKKPENHEGFYFMEGNAYDNAMLPANYVDTQRALLPQELFEVEVLNKRISQIPHSFYPEFSEKHIKSDIYEYQENKKGLYVKNDKTDYNSDDPLELTFDFNTYFTFCAVSQLDIPSNELRFSNEFYAKNKNLPKLLYNIANTYQDHKNKTIYVYGDRNGYDKDEAGKSTYDRISDYFHSRNEGWRVIINAIKGDIYHKRKFEFINEVLKEDNKNKYPKIRVNRYKCKSLILSIRLTPLRKNDFKKDKRSEAATRHGDPTQSTHASDSFDYRVYPLILNKNYQMLKI